MDATPVRCRLHACASLVVLLAVIALAPGRPARGQEPPGRKPGRPRVLFVGLSAPGSASLVRASAETGIPVRVLPVAASLESVDLASFDVIYVVQIDPRQARASGLLLEEARRRNPALSVIPLGSRGASRELGDRGILELDEHAAACWKAFNRESLERLLRQARGRPRRAREENTVRLAPVMIFGKEIPGSIYEYRVAEDDRTRTEDVGHALQRIPGFNLLDEQTTGLWSNVGIRGTDPLRSRGVLTLLDGVPAMLSLFGDNDWHVLPSLEQLERIEVVKGGSAVLYGPNAVGGVVNFVTKEIPEEPSARLQTKFGSYGLFIGEVGAGGTFDGTGIYLRHTHKQTDGWRDHSTLQTEDTHLKFASRVGSRGDLRLTLNHFQSTSETPGALTPEEYRRNPRKSFTPNDLFRGRRLAMNTRYSHHLSDSSSFKITVYAQRMERFWRIARRSTTSADIWDLTGTFAGIEPQYLLQWDDPFGGRSELTAGFRLHVESSERTKMKGSSPTARSGPAAILDIWNAAELAPYVQNDAELFEGFHLNLGVRGEWYRLAIEDRMTGVKGASDVGEPIWGVGARYEIGDGTIFAGVNRYLDTPQPQEEIDSKTGRRRHLKNAFVLNHEVGIRSNHLDWLPIDFTLFWLDYRDKVVRQGFDYLNLDRSMHRGAELSFTLRAGPLVPALDGLELFGNGMLLQTRVRRGKYEHNRLAYAPPKTFNGGIRYTHPIGLSAYVEGIYTDRQFSDAANTRAETPDGAFGMLDARTIYNLGFSYENKEHDFSVFAGVKNLFDKRYKALRWIWWGGLFPGAARSLYFGLSKRF